MHSLKQKEVSYIPPHFGIPKYYLKIQSVFGTLDFSNLSRFYHLDKELLRGPNLPFGGPHSHNLCFDAPKMRLHTGVRLPSSPQSRGSIPVSHLWDGFLQPSQEPEEVGRQRLRGP